MCSPSFLQVDDIHAAVMDLKAKKIRSLSEEATVGAHGKPVVFLHPKDCGGVLVELEQAWLGSAGSCSPEEHSRTRCGLESARVLPSLGSSMLETKLPKEIKKLYVPLCVCVVGGTHKGVRKGHLTVAWPRAWDSVVSQGVRESVLEHTV